jgi:hypothetical protein
MLEQEGVAGTEIQDPEAFPRELRAALTTCSLRASHRWFRRGGSQQELA